MTRTPRVCLVLIVVALLALLTAPLAGARPVTSASSAHQVDSGWLSAALHWAADLAGLRSQGHRGSTLHQKDGPLGGGGGGLLQPNGGPCIDPFGRPTQCSGI